MNNKSLYTGMWLFSKPGADGQNFGAADAVSPPRETGTVRLSLDLRQVSMNIEGDFAYIEMPEEWIAELVGVLGKTALRLQHLRELYKLGLLTQDALHDDDDAGSAA
ncbi:hypothetical protein WMF30_54245 [Sorangium sp. So ce134]